MSYYGWRPYVPVAERRRRARAEMARRKKKGEEICPVEIEGRTIARTFWGKSWCRNLEKYSDYTNRLPRGRTYVRNGSVVHLEIRPREVVAVVSGSELYDVNVAIEALPKARWSAITRDCAGSIDSLVELLAGRFSKGVMERICQEGKGLFPSPKEIRFSCSCPDWASMCKHVAAVLYGVGARLDEEPELLFCLREVDEADLLARAGDGLALEGEGPSDEKILSGDGLEELFGVELAAVKDGRKKRSEKRAPATRKAGTRKAGTKKAPAKKAPAKKAAAKKAGAKKAGAKKAIRKRRVR